MIAFRVLGPLEVRRLRQALGEANAVRTTGGGHVVDVAPGALDLDRFREPAKAEGPA